MNDLQDFINIQKNALKLKDSLTTSMKQCIPEYEKYFYFDCSFFQYKKPESLNKRIYFNFYLPNISNADETSLYELKLALDITYSKKDKSFSAEPVIECRVNKVSSHQAFFLLNIENLDQQAINDFRSLFLTPSVGVTDISKVFESNNINSKANSSDIKFTDFLLQMNQQHIQIFLEEQLFFTKNTKKLSIPPEKVAEIKNSFNNDMELLIGSIHAKKDLGLGLNKFDDFIRIIERYDIIHNHAQLDKQLSPRNNTQLKQKI